MLRQQNACVVTYLPVVEYIIEGIRQGKFSAQEKIPSETDLMRQFALSRYNVRQALGRLEKTGWITTVQGKGSYVRPRPPVVSYRVSSNTRFTDNMRQAGKKYQALLLEWQLGSPSADEAKQLLLTAKQAVYRLEVLRSIEGVPVSLTTSVLPEEAVPKLEHYLGEFYSLYAILESRYNFRPIRVKTVIQATWAKVKEADYLRMPIEVPILRTESLMYHPAGYPVEYCITRTCGDMCYLCVDFGSAVLPGRGGAEETLSATETDR